MGGARGLRPEKGSHLADPAAREALRRAGISLGQRWPIFEIASVAEPHLRRLFLADVRSDPCWFAVILARRVWATLAQAKLAPWAPK